MHEAKLTTVREEISGEDAKTAFVPTHRVVFHVVDTESPQLYLPKLPAEDSVDQLSRKLGLLIDFGFATRGRVEKCDNENFGWSVSKEGSDTTG